MQYKILISLGVILSPLLCLAQHQTETYTSNYNPDRLKIIPDKLFEIGIPLLILFLVLHTLITILNDRAEHLLKLKMIEKGVSEDALLKIFKESNAIAKLQPLKWFLFMFGTAMSLMCMHFMQDVLVNQSGYLAVGIFLVFISAAFITYHAILSRKV